ncbi:hypothetical protein JW921_09045, partial [Candidatus Fermentibacterales bacterium]|nr:hypothetical protein [Candidatus Fermentibacterales bacterium]
MRCGIPLLLLAVLVAAPERASALAEEDSLGWTCGAHILLHGGGSADYAEGGWAADSAAFEARGLVFLRRSESRLEALVAARHDDDTMRVMLREAEAFLRWPGTPWIGAGGFAGRRAPFEPAFGEPLLEHGFQSPDSLRGIYVSSGGVLGFEMEAGFGKAEEDRDLETLVVDAPWLGFGTFSYGRTEISEP